MDTFAAAFFGALFGCVFFALVKGNKDDSDDL